MYCSIFNYLLIDLLLVEILASLAIVTIYIYFIDNIQYIVAGVGPILLVSSLNVALARHVTWGYSFGTNLFYSKCKSFLGFLVVFLVILVKACQIIVTFPVCFLRN